MLSRQTGSDEAMALIMKAALSVGFSKDETKTLLSKKFALEDSNYGTIGHWNPAWEQLLGRFEPVDRKAIQTLLTFSFHAQRREAQILSLSPAFSLQERIAQAKTIGLNDPVPTTILDTLVDERRKMQFLEKMLPDNQIRSRLQVNIREKLAEIKSELGKLVHPRSVVETLDK